MAAKYYIKVSKTKTIYRNIKKKKKKNKDRDRQDT